MPLVEEQIDDTAAPAPDRKIDERGADRAGGKARRGPLEEPERIAACKLDRLTWKKRQNDLEHVDAHDRQARENRMLRDERAHRSGIGQPGICLLYTSRCV